MQGWQRFGVAVLLVAVVGCGGSQGPTTDIGGEFQSMLEKAAAAEPLVFGAALHVDGPGIDWEGAVGFADPEGGVAMTAEHPVRLASNTKTYVAAAVLRLVEQGRLELDRSIAGYLPAELNEILISGGYDPEVITIRHLLTHTSGLDDHGAGDNYGELIMADPQRRWTRTDQLGFLVEWGKPQGEPEEVYRYSDSGYILLGEILERTTGKNFPGAVWELIDRQRLGLHATWFETLEPQPNGTLDRAHQFFGDLDTAAFDPSFDLWGGGGIVATVGDLARFTRALFEGRVFDDPTTLETMLTTFEGLNAPEGAGEQRIEPGAYRMGLWVVEVGGLTGWRHSGFWGTSATYFPELDLVITGTQNQNHGQYIISPLVEEIVVRVR
ncbi:MAG: serine hydrolase domain-containing protein [Acidobacteriota bacterium]